MKTNQASTTQMASMAIDSMSTNTQVQELVQGVESLQSQINTDAGLFNSTGKAIKQQTVALIAKQRGETVAAAVNAIGQIERTIINARKRLVEKEVMADVQRLSKEILNIHSQSQVELTKLINDPGAILAYEQSRRHIIQQAESGELSEDFAQAMYNSYTEAGHHHINKQTEIAKNLIDHYGAMKRDALKIN